MTVNSEDHETVEWAQIFVTLLHPLCSTVPLYFVDEFQELEQ